MAIYSKYDIFKIQICPLDLLTTSSSRGWRLGKKRHFAEGKRVIFVANRANARFLWHSSRTIFLVFLILPPSISSF